MGAECLDRTGPPRRFLLIIKLSSKLKNLLFLINYKVLVHLSQIFGLVEAREELSVVASELMVLVVDSVKLLLLPLTLVIHSIHLFLHLKLFSEA